MPFTLTHIAAILPVAAAAPRAFPFSALVVGSMIPDIPLFVPLPITYATTHSITGIFLACVPLGMACLVTFQCLMKLPLLALLPELIRSRCASLSISHVEPTFKFFSSAALAILIGATTHVFWDSFTHQGRWGSSLFPQLNDNVLTIWGYHMPGYKALQYGSSLVLCPVYCATGRLLALKTKTGSARCTSNSSEVLEGFRLPHRALDPSVRHTRRLDVGSPDAIHEDRAIHHCVGVGSGNCLADLLRLLSSGFRACVRAGRASTAVDGHSHWLMAVVAGLAVRELQARYNS